MIFFVRQENAFFSASNQSKHVFELDIDAVRKHFGGISQVPF